MTIDEIKNTDQTWAITDPNPTATRNAARRIKNSSGSYGFFKTPLPHIIGNEVLAYVIGDRLSLPCAKAVFAKLFEENGVTQNGVISLRVSGFEPIEWDLLPKEITGNLRKFVMNGQDLAKIGVFDVWSYNLDRGGVGNLIISRKDEWSRKYSVYMIDHEECFYGLPENFSRTESDGNWNKAESFIKIEAIKEAIKFSDIQEFLSEIEAITNEELKSLIDLIPSEYYDTEKAEKVYNLLAARKTQIRSIMQEWCTRENKL